MHKILKGIATVTLSCTVIAGAASCAKKQTQDITLTSFNIRTYTKEELECNNWENRKDAVMAYISGMKTDVICLQEVKQSQYEDLVEGLDERLGIVYYVREIRNNAEGLAIVYDKTVWEKIEENRFWLSPTPEIETKGWDASHYRICVNVLLEHKQTSARLNVFNVHLDVKSALAREKGIELVLERAKESDAPVFVCGDFNCKSTDTPYEKASAVLQDCQAVAPDSDNGVTFQDWGKKADDAGTPIDFCFADKKKMQPLSFAILRDKWGDTNENYYADHYAVQTKVRLEYKTKKGS